ncbi:hypothetical protein [Duganella sp. BuS-21]|uniref:hypothetical protein n=1 Tax=Duganella sp. BuS-21 TaxID=2943848 RepID=UPI0035A742E5
MILEVVEDVSNGKLLRCLKLLQADDVLLIEAASRSYRHQLGFLKLVLMTGLDGACLRLHVWDRLVNPVEDIHSHCADFMSRVVLGRLEENAFELAGGETHALFRYHFDVDAGHSVAVKGGLTGICLRESRTVFQGEAYIKHAFDLHSVGNVVPGTVTVSAWGARNGEALVLKPLDAEPEDCAAASGMPVEQMRAMLANIKERLLHT